MPPLIAVLDDAISVTSKENKRKLRNVKEKRHLKRANHESGRSPSLYDRGARRIPTDLIVKCENCS